MHSELRLIAYLNIAEMMDHPPKISGSHPTVSSTSPNHHKEDVSRLLSIDCIKWNKYFEVSEEKCVWFKQSKGVLVE